jgi:NhaA family Na+:H+ antiporter
VPLAKVPHLHPESPLVERVFGSFQQFAHSASAGGLVLLACTAIALAWANSPWEPSYHDLWEVPITVGSPRVGLTLSLRHWVNDLLMAVFFLLVGLEIKREVLVGELASRRTAALPMAAAIGGMVVPALLYSALNAGGPGSPGWGIPMATDIAFALGVLALLGSRVPVGLKVFLAALAIADDIGAVLVIAVFYTSKLSWEAIGGACGVLLVLALANRSGTRHLSVYIGLGLALWLAVHASGIHATVAGVLLALTIPARSKIEPDEFAREATAGLEEFRAASSLGATGLTSPAHQEAVQALKSACEAVQAPLQNFEHKLQGIVAFGILPLFALANAGVPLHGGDAGLTNRITLGIILGLVFGKPLGITLASWLAVRWRIAELPAGVSWRGLHGASWLAGIGFTMSLFITGLAFSESALQDAAKLGILAASFGAGIVGWVMLRTASLVGDPERRGRRE